MKTILRIILVLLVASIVAAGFSLAVNNSSTSSSFSEGGQMPAMTDANGQTVQPMERPDGGDHEGASVANGLVGVLGTLAKLTGIAVLVLALQKGFEQINNMKKWKLVQ